MSRRSKSRFAAHDVVTLTDYMLEHVAIGNVELAATVFNRMHRLQSSRGDRDARTTSTEPARNDFLRQTQVSITHPVVKH